MPRIIKVMHEGIPFRSIKERNRYITLKELLAKDEIFNLRYKQQFPIIVNEIRIMTYIPSFTYKDKDMNYVVEHFRSTNSSFKKIAKLMLACYGITVQTY
jgi:hypothetical protein